MSFLPAIAGLGPAPVERESKLRWSHFGPLGNDRQVLTQRSFHPQFAVAARCPRGCVGSVELRDMDSQFRLGCCGLKIQLVISSWDHLPLHPWEEGVYTLHLVLQTSCVGVFLQFDCHHRFWRLRRTRKIQWEIALEGGSSLVAALALGRPQGAAGKDLGEGALGLSLGPEAGRTRQRAGCPVGHRQEQQKLG